MYHVSLLSGEWEISAFDGKLKGRGMSIRYTVRPCDNGDLPLVDHDGDEDDITDYIDQIDLRPRGLRPQNHTVMIRVCKKLPANNNTQSAVTTGQNATVDGDLACQLKKVTVASPEGGNNVNEGGIPQDILEEIERGGEWTVAQNETEPERGGGSRQKRQAEGNWTDGDISSGATEDEETVMEIEGDNMENRTDTGEMPSERNGTKEDLEESNEILLDSNPLLNKKVSAVEVSNSQEMDRNLVPQNHIQTEPEQQTVDLLSLDYNYTADNNNTSQIDLSLEYDDYTQEVLLSVCVCM